MYQHLALFDPGWRDFSVRVSNTEITVIWVLAALLGALLYHLFLGRRGGAVDGKWQTRLQTLEKELHDEKGRHQRLKQQLDGAQAKANSFASSMSDLEKTKARIQDLQKEVEAANKSAEKFRLDYENEHSKVTSMIVDHSEAEALKNRVKNQEKELSRSREESTRLRTELDSVQAERVRMAKALDESQMADMRNKIQRLENDLQSSRLMVIKYQSDSSRMEEERARMRQQEELTKELEGLRESLSKSEDELKASRTRLTELAGQKLELDRLQAALKESEAKLSSNHDLLTDSEARIAALEAELAALRKSSSEAIAVHTTTSAPMSEAGHTEPSPAAPLETAAAVVAPDDLKRVEGIGPKLEQMLNEHGIHTFAQLAASSTGDLQAILDKGGDAYRIHDPGTWPQQAGLLAEGRIEEFEALTERLKGGREVE